MAGTGIHSLLSVMRSVDRESRPCVTLARPAGRLFCCRCALCTVEPDGVRPETQYRPCAIPYAVVVMVGLCPFGLSPGPVPAISACRLDGVDRCVAIDLLRPVWITPAPAGRDACRIQSHRGKAGMPVRAVMSRQPLVLWKNVVRPGLVIGLAFTWLFRFFRCHWRVIFVMRCLSLE